MTDTAQPSASPSVASGTQAAFPPVVAVMVVHAPGEWFAEAVGSLASQDYPGLQHLVLVSGADSDVRARALLDIIQTRLPSAVVRFLGANVGFAAACNSVLQLVQGDSGFFCFLHDDVALAPDAITRMVEELYRSNAGLVGPKVVHWNDPRMIQSVGTAVDRFGVELPIAEDGEIDQEQHDAVQDVFVVSSACMLVRADLFRSIGGFNPRLSRVGADLDLCWRCHIAAARVVIVPAAVARHVEAGAERVAVGGTDDEDPLLEERERVRVQTAVSLASPGQLPMLLVQLTVHTLLRVVVLAATGRLRRSFAEARSVLALPLEVGTIRARRSALAGHRQVDGAEVRALQLRGSAHLSSYMRRRNRLSGLAQSVDTGPVREATARSARILWTVLVVMLLVGSRRLMLDGVAVVGQMVPSGGRPAQLLASYVSGWWGAGFGHASALPTGMAVVAAGGYALLGHMELLRTLTVVLLPFVGWIGVWVLCGVLGSRASRVAGTATYAAVPLAYASIASGRWGALLLYAVLPWMLHLMRLLVGHSTVVEGRNDSDTDSFARVSPARRRRALATLVVLSAVACAFEPAVIIVVPFVVVVCAAVGVVLGAPVSRSLRWLSVGFAGLVGGIALNIPWVGAYVRGGWWESIVGAPVPAGRDWGIVRIASFGVGHFAISGLCLFLYAAVVGAVVLVRGAKTPWAMRGAVMVAVGLLLALLDDTNLLPAHLAEPAVMLVPVALGLAICAGAAGALLVVDVRRGRFSWRQPLGGVLALAFCVGLVAAPLNALNGQWSQPSVSLAQLLEQLPGGDGSGEYRTLFLGDARVLPGSPLNFGWGIAYSVVNGSSPTLTESWETQSSRARDNLVMALYGIVRGQTGRAGRLLAPLSVRYIVVPIIDGAESRRDDPIAAPRGLVDALARQLDLRRRYASPDLVIFENSTWVPVRSVLTESGAAASARAGAESMIASDISGATPISGPDRPDGSVAAQVPAGTVHLSVPFSTQWGATVDGRAVAARPAFGLTTAFDVSSPGTITISFDDTLVHALLVIVQFALWCIALFLILDRRREDDEGIPTGRLVIAGQQQAVIVLRQGVES